MITSGHFQPVVNPLGRAKVSAVKKYSVFPGVRWFATLALTLTFAGGMRAQLTLTSSDTNFKSALVSPGVAINDIYDGPGNLDLSKQSSLAGSSSPWDLVGTSSQAVVQIASGAYAFGGSVGTQNALLFRVRTAYYDSRGPGSGSVVVLFNTGSVATSFGIAASFNNSAGTTPSSFSWVTPGASTTLTSAFSYSVTAVTAGRAVGSYVQANTIAGTTNTTFSNYSGNDAYTTFAVLSSDLNGKAGGTFAISTPVTVFTNNNTNLSQINSDWVGDPSTGYLTFGAVPEPATWAQCGVLSLTGAFVWWRRRRGPKAS